MAAEGSPEPQELYFEGPVVPPRQTRPVMLPLALFLLTCLTTVQVGGWIFALALMTILSAHELGHYVQARRYGVPTSLPYFLPMPAFFSPFGTLGAVIAMRPSAARSRGLFDIAISGPLAGLVPSLMAAAWGIRLSEPRRAIYGGDELVLGASFLFRRLEAALVDIPPGYSLDYHPLAYAGWVGLFVTALNLMPVGQLDGGHILYALAPKSAYRVSLAIVALSWVWMLWEGYWLWVLMLILVTTLGLRHPPVEPGGEPIGPVRRLLGWATLFGVLLIFSPKPIAF